MNFQGLAVALVTPFDAQGAVDEAGLRRVVRHVVAGGVDVLVALGSTGEAATLVDEERDQVIRVCLAEAQGRPVVVGTGSNSTRQTEVWTRRAQELGAAGALVVTPFYNKPTPEGLLAHYAAVAAAAPGLPLILYNVPGRTGLNVSPTTLQRLWENPQVVAVKESSGNMAQIGEIARCLPPGKLLLSGDDNLALPSIAVGAAGLVSVLGNALPAQTRALVEAGRAGRREAALSWHQALLPLMDALFLESNPIPLKALMEQLGLCGAGVRLPLVPAKPETRQRLAEALRPVRERDPRQV
ncbi:MAG TPA: 4-hydroxy-tetrahydrodipicolinate synthase [Gemmatales bacterium]|nr:4-hydroxy-tetrahydrodipicolinate synthase [Gemmatales bacterium]